MNPVNRIRSAESVRHTSRRHQHDRGNEETRGRREDLVWGLSRYYWLLLCPDLGFLYEQQKEAGSSTLKLRGEVG